MLGDSLKEFGIALPLALIIPIRHSFTIDHEDDAMRLFNSFEYFLTFLAFPYLFKILSREVMKNQLFFRSSREKLVSGISSGDYTSYT